jgi:hypothetical protein
MLNFDYQRAKNSPEESPLWKSSPDSLRIIYRCGAEGHLRVPEARLVRIIKSQRPPCGVGKAMVKANTANNNRDVSATLKFITPTSKFNRRYVAPGQEVNTGVYEDKKVEIKDGRTERAELSLDTSGFTLFNHKSKATCPVNSSNI